jgi:hypothetical protein
MMSGTCSAYGSINAYTILIGAVEGYCKGNIKMDPK